LKDSFAIMITKIVDPNDDNDHLLEEINKIHLSENRDPKVIELLGYGLKNLHQFRKPKEGKFQN